MPSCGCRLRSLVRFCWIVLFAVRKGSAGVNFVVLGHRRKVSALCLLYKIYHRAAHPLHEYLHHFVAARSTRASVALGELALVIPRCRID